MSKPLKYTTSPICNSYCDCGNHEMWIMATTYGVRMPSFYICWVCKNIYQIGVGKVEIYREVAK